MSNFADGPHDLSKFSSSGEMPIWGFDDHSGTVLLELTADHRVVRRL